MPRQIVRDLGNHAIQQVRPAVDIADRVDAAWLQRLCHDWLPDGKVRRCGSLPARRWFVQRGPCRTAGASDADPCRCRQRFLNSRMATDTVALPQIIFPGAASKLVEGERWFAVHTQPYGELRAQANLENQGFRTFMPRRHK